MQTQTYISKGLLQNVANITLSKMDQQWWLFIYVISSTTWKYSCKILARGVQSKKNINGSHLEGLFFLRKYARISKSFKGAQLEMCSNSEEDRICVWNAYIILSCSSESGFKGIFQKGISQVYTMRSQEETFQSRIPFLELLNIFTKCYGSTKRLFGQSTTLSTPATWCNCARPTLKVRTQKGPLCLISQTLRCVLVEITSQYE